jgi:hypothetical protein
MLGFGHTTWREDMTWEDLGAGIQMDLKEVGKNGMGLIWLGIGTSSGLL